MFLDKITLKPSAIHGIGVFADQFIPKGTPVYRHTDALDLRLTPEEFSRLDPREQALIRHYGYREKHTGLYRLDHDDIRFVNDSNTPTIGLDPESGTLVALRDTAPGEELTQNYSDFESRRFGI